MQTHKVEGSGTLTANITAPRGTDVTLGGGGIFKKHLAAASQFRFTAAERSFPPGALRQFGPGDRVAIYLGNSLVIDGYLEHRQVGYDATRHLVELMGVNVTAPVMRSSVDTATGKFDKMSFIQVAGL